MKKFLPRRRHEFVRDNIVTTFDYILEEDIQTFHSQDWIREWDTRNISSIDVEGKKAFYYYDYKNIAIGINYYLP